MELPQSPRTAYLMSFVRQKLLTELPFYYDHCAFITPSQIAIDAARVDGGDPLDYCDICGCDRGDHAVSARNYLIPCESDGEWESSD